MDLIRKKSLKDEVFELLHNRIITGEYSSGEWLRQEEISTQLGVSQTPVREALDRLVSEGLAERTPYRGVHIPEFSEEAIVDAYVVRLLLEATTVRLAALNISQEQQDHLFTILEQTKNLLTLDEMPTYRRLNNSLHRTIAYAGGNPLLGKLYDVTANKFPAWKLYECMGRQPDLLQSSLAREYKEHTAVVNAITSHNLDMAVSQAIEHVQNVGKEIVTFLEVPNSLLEKREQQIMSLLRMKSKKESAA